MVAGMDTKQRTEFDSTLNSGVGESSWARVEGRAWERLLEGEFDTEQDGTEQDNANGGGE